MLRWFIVFHGLTIYNPSGSYTTDGNYHILNDLNAIISRPVETLYPDSLIEVPSEYLCMAIAKLNKLDCLGKYEPPAEKK